MNPAPWLVVSYLLGAIPSSYIAGRLARGIDLREYGSGNLGATNAFRVLGTRIAAPVMVFDLLKGFFPVWYFPRWDGSTEWAWALLYGAAAIVGHVFPAYMRFRGGKGVATAAGVFLAIVPYVVGIALLVWLATLLLFRMVSLASIAAAVALLIALFVTPQQPTLRGLGIAIAGFVIFAHRANIGRILRGEERRIGRSRGTSNTIGGEAP